MRDLRNPSFDSQDSAAGNECGAVRLLLGSIPGGAVASRKQIVFDVALWIVSFFLVWVFVRQGVAKFSDTSGWARAFRIWHFPVWFRVLIGILEVTACVLLLTRRTAFAGALIIIVVMIGAMGTHVYWGRPGQVTSEIVPLTLATIIAFGRRRTFLWPLRRSEAA
jgi:uncharacterized membrane protein YphA (DoxX/SURF4 family)